MCNYILVHDTPNITQKKPILVLLKQKKNYLSLHYSDDNSYLYVNGKEIYIFKASKKNNNFQSQFCLGSISNKFDHADKEEITFKANLYEFLVDYDAIDKSNILNIHKYLMIKNSI